MQSISKLVVRTLRMHSSLSMALSKQSIRAPLLSSAPRFNFTTNNNTKTETESQENNAQEQKAKQEGQTAETQEQKTTQQTEADLEKALPNTVEELIKLSSELGNKKILTLYNQLKEQKQKLESQYKLVHEEKTAYQSQTAQWQEKAKEMKKIVEQTITDMDNMRIRLEKEKDQMKVFAITKFAAEVLEVNDNIDRALQANKDLPDKETNTLYEGTLMTQKILDKILERNGVVKLNPEGEKFDPNLHDALCQVPDATKEAGSVAFVAQTGYKIKERVLRPAKVGVTYKV